MKHPPVVHLSTVHRPTDTRIFQKEARTLAEAGYPVTVVAPAGKDEEQEGIRIRALRGPDRGWKRFTRTNPEAFRLARSYPEETIFHIHDPELLITAFALKRRGYRVIYDVHEDTPVWIRYQSWIPLSMRPLLSRFFAYLEARAARTLDGIVAATPTIAQRLEGPQTILLRNFPRKARFTEMLSVPYNVRPLQLFYAGGLSVARGLWEMLDTVKQLRVWQPVTLLLAGAFYPPGLEQEVRHHPAWKAVNFLGWQGPEVLTAHMARSRVGLALLHPIAHYREAYPTKIFEYMAAGLPFVVTDLPAIRPFVEDVGLLVDPRDRAAVIEAVRYLLMYPEKAQAMGERGRTRFLQELNWEEESTRLLALYERVAQHPVP